MIEQITKLKKYGIFQDYKPSTTLKPFNKFTRGSLYTEEIEVSSSEALSGNERIDIDAKIVLEGEDLSKSKIEDLTAVIH